MKWKKLGLVFCADHENELMVSGGRAPVPLHLHGERYRIYFAAYDARRRGRIFSLDIDLSNPNEILNLVKTPIVDIGQVGFYDDNGIIPSDIVQVDGSLYLYTIGFSLKNRIIFDAATGLAISNNGQDFEKLTGPVLDRNVDDPCFAASPCVFREAEQWRMWYVSCDRWEPKGDGYRHFYNIKHRTSRDGIYWSPKASICIDYQNKYEYAISRPSVIKEKNGRYRMWYSYRGQPDVETYRIGYAESYDGLKWVRKDSNVGIDVSPDGWDADMICYPYVFEQEGRKYMLYNGNRYGESGFGLAVLEDGA